VFVRMAGGEVERIRYVEGDGLSPMRFSELEPSGLCEAWPCRLETEMGRIVLLAPDSPAPVCMPASEADWVLLPGEHHRPAQGPSACAAGIDWGDVLRQGGLTLNVDGAPIQGAAPCQARPWKPCAREMDQS
jgi:competence protein ComEC